MYLIKGLLIAVFYLLVTCLSAQSVHNPVVKGWGSFGAYGYTVTEDEIIANARVMQTHLKAYGWEYVMLDNCWYYPQPASMHIPQQHDFNLLFPMDKFGRFMPDPERFPSSKSGNGLASLADKLHRMGLKFGVSIFRGIPRQAVYQNTRVKGTSFRARDIADTTSVCPWIDHNFGIDMNKPGAQQYYNSLFELLAEWGVDYVKVDDISVPLQEKELVAIRQAVSHCKRAIILSVGSDEIRSDKADLVRPYADSWRICNDISDQWSRVLPLFDKITAWESEINKGFSPDMHYLPSGMLSLRGHIEEAHRSKLTKHEQYALLTLSVITRSQLIFGGALTQLSTPELGMLCNSEVLSIPNWCSNSRLLFREDNQFAWMVQNVSSAEIYMAIFNLSDHQRFINVKLESAGIRGECEAYDVWMGDFLGIYKNTFRPEVPAHGVRLIKFELKE